MSFSFDPWAVLAEIRAEASGPAKAAKAAKAGETVATLAALAGWHAPEEKIGPARSASAPHPEIDTFAERAAIAEHDGGLTRPEAEVLAARDQGFTAPAGLYAAIARHWLVLLDSMEPGTDPHAPDCIAAARRFIAEGWAERALALGWLEVEILGLCPRAPWARRDRMGIAWTRHPVAAITSETVTWRAGASTLTRHRASVNSDRGAALPGEDPG